MEFCPDYYGVLSDAEADDGAAPLLLRAMREQLGIRVESGVGPVRRFIIEHISQPTAD